jgi:hypothetical protein
MARPPTTTPQVAAPAERLVADQFWVDLTHPLPGAGGGLPAFAVVDRREGQTGLMAVQVRRNLPPRQAFPPGFGSATIDGLVTPLAYGAAPALGGEEAGFLICPAPPGPSLAATLVTWPEPELLTLVLRPAARVLDQFAQRGLTHRGIRADNVFRAGPGHPVVLGCAWATPPAALQPAVAEPPYVAMCQPCGRGAGTVADDVYALGVLILALALGHSPLPGMAEPDIVRLKLDQGSYAALVGDHRLGNLLADLLRGMLADDPDHRPPPSLLLDPAAARSRRIAARPMARGGRPIQIGNLACWHPRTLAHALAVRPEQGLQALKSGVIGTWLRRGFGDGALAVRLEEQPGLRGATPDDEVGDSAPLSLMRAVAILDPLAPMCWSGLSLWPDAIGTMLAAMQDSTVLAKPEQMKAEQAKPEQAKAEQLGADQAGLVVKLIKAEAQVTWIGMRQEQVPDASRLRLEARQLKALLHVPGAAGGLARLTYQLNPLLPCLSPGLAGRWVTRLAELLSALEAGRDRAQTAPIGAAMVAFIAARGDRALETVLGRLGDAATAADPPAQLRLLAQLQARYHPRPLPVLGAWFAERIEPLLAAWHSRPRRDLLRPKLRELAVAGQLVQLLALLDDPQARSRDEHEAQQAARTLVWIDSALARLNAGGPARADRARRLGQEVAAGVGLTALATLLMIAALG